MVAGRESDQDEDLETNEQIVGSRGLDWVVNAPLNNASVVPAVTELS